MTTITIIEEKINVLAQFLDCQIEEIEDQGDNRFSIGYHRSSEFLVLTEEEADKAAREYILDSLWAFKPSFILDHMKSTPEGYEYEMLEKAISRMQNDLCESCNALVLALIYDIDLFIENAISADGRGHFLGLYDGEENEEGNYLIYRL